MSPNTIAKVNRWEPLLFAAWVAYFLFEKDWGSAMLFAVLVFYAWERNRTLYGPIILSISAFHRRHQPELLKLREKGGHTGQLSRTALLEMNSKIINKRNLILSD